MAEIPSIEEELERKANETLMQVLTAFDAGEIDAEIVVAIIATIWDVTAGLISRELMDMLADTRDAMAEERVDPRRRVLRKGDVTAIVDLPCQATRALNLTLIQGSARQVPIETDGMTRREIASCVGKRIRALLNKGFKEIT